MAKKQKIYNTSMVDILNANIRNYNNYLSPNVDVDAYLHQMQNPTIDREPDNYSAWNSAFATWNKNRNEVNKDSSLGDYILAEEELTSLTNAQQYLQDKEELNQILSNIDPTEGVDDETKSYTNELIDRIKSNEQDYLKSFDNILQSKQDKPTVFTGELYLALPDNKQDYFKEDSSKQLDILDKEIKLRQDRMNKYLEEAKEYAANAEEWNNKIDDYYREMSEKPGMDFTDLDTYVYKVPGLIGSSAATIGANVLGLVGAGLMAVPDPTGITKLAGAAVLVGSNIYSRDNESSAEAYQAYKESIRKKAQDQGIEKSILKNAKKQMQNSGLYTAEQIDNDDYVYDQILTGKVEAQNEKLKSIQQSSLDGMSSVYKDNMALSTWDIAQDVLTVFPLGKIAKVAKSVVPSKLIKGLDKANDMRQQVSRRIDDVVSYGLEGLDKLPNKRTRKRLMDLGGRLVLSASLEGAEEGTQYMLSKDMQAGIYDADAGLFNRWLHNVGRGARSLYAALTPFDPVYSNDAEFIENFKGGALLGGIMTAGVGGAGLVGSSIDYGRNQYPVTQVMASMYADKLDATDRVRKNLAYAEYMRNDKWGRIENAFDDLKEAKVEGVDEQMIEDERKRARMIRNVYTSPVMRKHAEELGIDPRTEDYSLLVALYDHHEQLFDDAKKSLNEADAQVTSLLNSDEVNKYIEDLDIVKSDKVDANTVRTAIWQKAYLDTMNKIIDRFDQYRDAQSNLQEKTGIRTSKSDIIEVSKLLEKDKNIHQRDYDLSESIQALKAIEGFDESILSVPAIHQDLSDAMELVIGNQLDVARAEAERTIMRSNDKQLVQGKINRYKQVQDGEAELVQRLNDMYSGKNEQDVVDEAVEVDIPVVDEVEPSPAAPIEVGEPPVEEQPTERIQNKTEESKPENTVFYEKDEQGNITSYTIDDLNEEKEESQSQIEQGQLKQQEIQNNQKESETNQEQPQTLNDVLSGILGPTYDEALQNQQAEQPIQTPTEEQEQPVDETPLTYDKNVDSYSHLMGYWMTQTERDSNGNFIKVSRKYSNALELSNNEELGEITGKSDFYEQMQNTATFEVRDYVDPTTGLTEDSIYMVFTYNGKKYGTYVSTERGLKNNRQFARLSQEQQQTILQNLRNLRNKIINLSKGIKNDKSKKIVPTHIRVTNGQIRNERNDDGTAKNHKLTESRFLEQKDPTKINYQNTMVAVTTGPIGGNYSRIGEQIVSMKNSANMGMARLITKVRRGDGTYGDVSISLNTANFKNSPELVDFILDLLVNPGNQITLKDNVIIPVRPLDMLQFIVNFGAHTATDPEDVRLSPEQRQKRISKQFYQVDNTHFVIGPTIYTIDDILGERRDEIKKYIQDNFHWAIPEHNLNRNWFGGNSQSKVKAPGFEQMSVWFKNSGKDKIQIAPGFEFTKEDFGVGTENPNGISTLGWYIRQGVLLTDVSNEMPNANIYVDDVTVVDVEAQKTVNDAIKRVAEPKTTDKEYDLPGEGGARNTFKWSDIQEILDGKKRKKEDGPNMTIEHDAERVKVNVEEAKQWLSDKLGIDVETVPIVIDITEAGLDVVGRVTEDATIISEKAPEGVQYHEAWHNVSLFLLSPKKRANLYKKYIKRGMDEKQAEDYLAEQYRDFMTYADSKKDSLFKFDFDSKNLFRQMFDFNRLWLRVGKFGLAKVMYYTSIGKYKGLTPNPENVARFREIYPGGVNMEVAGTKLKSITTEKQLDDIVKSLLYAFFQTDFSNQTIDYTQLAKVQPNFENLKRLLRNTQATDVTKINPTMDEIIEKFDSVIAPRLKTKLKQLGIRAFDKQQSDVASIEEGAAHKAIGQHTIEGMNISIKDNAPAEVKFFMMTIPVWEYNKEGKIVNRLHPTTGFPMFHESNKVWNNVLKDLSGCRTIQNIVDRVARLSEQDMFYKALLGRLTTLIQNSVKDDRIGIHSEAMLTKIEVTITGDINNFTTLKVEEDEIGMSKHKLIDNGVDVMAIKYPKIWSQWLFRNSGLFDLKSDGVYANNNTKHKLKTISKRLTQLITIFTENKGIVSNNGVTIDFHEASTQENLKADIIGIFQSLGIQIDLETLNRLLGSGNYGDANADQYSKLSKFVVSTANYGGLLSLNSTINSIIKAINNDNKISNINIGTRYTDIENVWTDNGFVKSIANMYAYTHATDRGLSTLGPDGNSYYKVSQNNFFKDRVNELNTDAQTRTDLSSVIYNTHSVVLQAAKDGNHLEVETFINFKDTTSQDTGRDYFGITDREDYVAKMDMIFADRLISPTVADKKTYHTIKGIKLPHEAVNYEDAGNGQYCVTYGEQTLDILLGYVNDEYERVKLTLQQIDDDNKDNPNWLPPSKRIKNYHTPNKYKGKDGKWHKIEGNGARFIYFNGITIAENGRAKFINFNDPTKTAKENLKIAEENFFSLPIDHQKRLLSGVISQRVREEINTAKGLGLIESNEAGNIWSLRNKLLDDTVVAQRSQRYRGMSPSNAEGFAIWDMFADYVVGSIMSVTEIEKLFSGDPAYYKVIYNENGMIDNSVDKIKRLTAQTATGTNNRLDFFNAEVPTEYTVTEFADHEIRSKQWDELEGLFVRGNIKETIQELEGEDAWNEVKDKTTQEIEKIYPEAVKIAKQAAKNDVSGYKKGINVADAAVYITPKMFQNLMRMQGMWSPEIKRAFEILTNEDTADKWQSDPKLYSQANKVILNALKYMAFGTRYRDGLGIPYFNKMALFPLFKSVATGDLKLLYDRMTEPGNEIDMVLFNSAVKAGSESPQSFYRVAKDSELDLKDGQTVISARMQDAIESGEGTVVSDLSQLHTYKQSFKYLRQQLLTDPHIHEEQMAGTQFVKVNLSNIRMNDMYGKPGDQKSGETIFREIMDDINTLSDLGKAELEAELLDENGEVDQRKLAKMLLDDAMESDANDNIIAALQDVIRTGSFDDMPLSAMSDNKWLESRFISLINKKIIDINIAGGAFIQRSAFGMEATDSRVITPSMINDGRVLKTINEEGSMDAVVSINLFKHIIPDYKNKTFTEAKQWLLDHNIIGSKATANTIGYRIPTQSVASISPLRFVDVFPEIMGDTIMLPEDFTKLTGSDFDIDKLYVARLQYDSEGNLITEGAEGIKNHMLQNYLRVLLTKDNTSSLKLSIDVATDNVKAVLEDIEGNQSKNIVQPFYPYSPTYQEAKKSEYTGGKAGIGPFALNNAHHILTQLTKLHMVRNEFTYRLNIWDVSRIFDNPTAATKKGGRILDWLSAMINAFVDIAKDPYIVRLNVNPWTYNMVSFLLRTGMGKQTFYFMSQPILKEMAQEVLKTKGKFGIDRTKTPTRLEHEAIEKVLLKYDPSGQNRKKYDYATRKPSTAARAFCELFDTFLAEDGETSMLRELIKNPDTENAMFAERQLQVYYAFKAIKPYADSLANLVKYSKIDTKKTGKSFAAQQTYLNGMTAMLDDENFDTGAVEEFFSETFIDRKTQNAIPFGTKLFRGLLLRNTDKFLAQKDAVLSLLGRRDNANEKLLSSVINAMESQTKAKFFNKYIKENNINIKDMFIGPNSMGQRLNNFKQRVLRNEFPDLGLDGKYYNDFLEYLLPNLNNEYGLNFVDVSELLSNDQTLDNNLINYWRELIQHPNERVSKLFKDLAVYAFFTTGDNTTMNGFFKYLPNSFRKEIGYSNYIADEMKQYNDKQIETVISREDIFLNNWTNDALVKPVDMYITVGESQYGLKSLNLTPDDQVPNLIVGERSNMKGVAIRPLNWASIAGYAEKFPVFPPFIKMKQGVNTVDNWHVYKLIGFKMRPKEDNPKLKDFIPVYGLVEKKGYKRRGHTIYEYDLPTSFDFNKERVYNYAEIIRQQEYLLYGITDNDTLKDEWTDIISNGGIHSISELPVYRKDVEVAFDSLYEEDEDFDNNDENAVPLSDKEEPTEKPGTINIYWGTGENAHLSNFAERPFELEGAKYSNVESEFQARKLDYSYFYRDYDGEPNDSYFEMQEKFEDVSGKEARKLGKRIAGLDVNSWDKASSGIMKMLIKESFKQNPDALQQLLDTGDAIITHNQDNSKWKTEFPRILMEVRDELKPNVEEESTEDISNNPSEFTNHSGGALGSDSIWDNIGKEFGVINHRHYYHGERSEYNAPLGNVEITTEDYEEGRYKVAQAAKRNWGYQYSSMKDDRLVRNWSQVKYSDSIFAIGTIVQPGEKVFPNQKNDTRLATNPTVTGGTGYAVGMAINEDKPVHVFDQTKNSWYTWDGENFVQEETPILTKDFAGIGTREINNVGKQAIRDVYEKTFGKIEISNEQKEQEGEQIKKQCKGE